MTKQWANELASRILLGLTPTHPELWRSHIVSVLSACNAHEPCEQPQYRKWPGEPPHCMSCSCGMTDEQKRTVPEADYLRVHKELMDLKYPGSSPADLVDALQDVVHTDPGPVRAAKAVKSIECPECFGDKQIAMSDWTSRFCEYCGGTGRVALKSGASQ